MAVQPGSLFAGPPAAYVADHDTAPPADQVIKTDPTSLLIRALQSRKAKEDARKGAAKVKQAGESGQPASSGTASPVLPATPAGLCVTPARCRVAADKGKRPAEAGDAGRATKRPASDGAGPSGSGAGAAGQPPGGPGPSEASYTRMALQARTIKDLQNVLRAWGLPISGKKEDLVSRILDLQAAESRPGAG